MMIFDSAVFMATGAILVFLGIASISISKNLVKTIMSFQVILFGANLALFASGLGFGFATDVGSGVGNRLLSDSFVLLSIMVGAAVESVGLAIIIMVHKKYGTLNPSRIKKLKN